VFGIGILPEILWGECFHSVAGVLRNDEFEGVTGLGGN
jgi:hypothetical protein